MQVAVKTIQVVAVGMDETIWCEGKAKAAYAELMALLSLSHLNENGPVRLLGARVVSETIPAGEVTSLRIVLELANKSLKKIIEWVTRTFGIKEHPYCISAVAAPQISVHTMART